MKEFLTAAALFISAELKVEEALEFTNRPKYQYFYNVHLPCRHL